MFIGIKSIGSADGSKNLSQIRLKDSSINGIDLSSELQLESSILFSNNNFPSFFSFDMSTNHIIFDDESTTKSSYNGTITDNIRYTGPKTLNIDPSTMAQYFFKM